MPPDPHHIRDLAALTALYGEPGITSLAKEVPYVHPHYRAIIERAPFAVLATIGPAGSTPRRAATRRASSSSRTSRRC